MLIGDREKPPPCQEKGVKKSLISENLAKTKKQAGDANATGRQFTARAEDCKTVGGNNRIQSTGVKLAHSKVLCLFHAYRARWQ